MTSVLVVWEDAQCEVLGELALRIVRATATGSDDVPRVERHTARSNGMFEHYVKETWPRVRVSGVPTAQFSIAHLICVVDADHLHDLIPGVGKAPPDAAAVASWHAAASATWQTWLRARCDPNGPPATTVHGVVLRWSKESLVLAGYDQPAAAVHLDIDPRAREAAAMLRERCRNHPADVDDLLFTDTFRQPRSCLDMLRQARKIGRLPKNAPAIDKALRALSRESLTIIRARVPDIDRLASLIWDLHRSGEKS